MLLGYTIIAALATRYLKKSTSCEIYLSFFLFLGYFLSNLCTLSNLVKPIVRFFSYFVAFGLECCLGLDTLYIKKEHGNPPIRNILFLSHDDDGIRGGVIKAFLLVCYSME